MDLSFPKGLSVNEGFLKDTYLGTFPNALPISGFDYTNSE